MEFVAIKEIVEYGLSDIPENQSITMKLRDFIFVYRALEEYMRFFHDSDHYPTIEAVKGFLGNVSSGGGFEVLNTALYKKMSTVKLPIEIKTMFDEGAFEHPMFPQYYQND